MPAQIVINVSAGTAQLVQDLDKAKAKIRDFGQSGVAEARAASAEFKLLEGAFTTNGKAAELFFTKILGGSKLVEAAFPVAGAIAFAGFMVDVGVKGYEAFKKIQDQAERARDAFAKFAMPLKTANDELALANARLEQDINKLQGRTQNNLAIAMLEAKVAMDKLDESVQNTLTDLHKLMNEGAMSQLWNAVQGNAGYGDVAKIVQTLQRQLRDESNPSQRNTDIDSALAQLYHQKNIAQQAQDLRADIAAHPDRYRDNGLGGVSVTPEDQSNRLEKLQEAIRTIETMYSRISLTGKNIALTTQDELLQAANANAKEARPFEDKLKALDAELAGIQERLKAAGQPEAFRVQAQAAADALKAIADVNKELERYHRSLDDSQKAQITAKELSIVQADAEEKWRTKLAQTTDTLTDQMKATEMLTAAVGRGYDATKRAAVETEVMRGVGALNYNDPAWMAAHASDVEKLRSGAGADFAAKHEQESAQAINSLRLQTSLYTSLAAVQRQGAEAVRQTTLAYQMQQALLNGASTKQLIAMWAAYEAERANKSAENVANIDQEIAATERLIAAQVGGEQAIRQAKLQNTLQGMFRGGATSEELVSGQKKEQADYELKIAEDAMKTGNAYADHLDLLSRKLDYLEKIKQSGQDSLAVEMSMRDVYNEQLRTMIEVELNRGTLAGGWAAFVYQQALNGRLITPGSILAGGLNESVSGIAGAIGSLAVHPNQNAGRLFGHVFQGVGSKIVTNSIEGALGKIFDKLGKKTGLMHPDGSVANPFYVNVLNWPGYGGGTDILGNAIPEFPNPETAAVNIPGAGTVFGPGGMTVAGKGSGLGAVLSTLGGLISSVAAGAIGGAKAGGRASGGDVYAGQIYSVNEGAGESEFFMPNVNGYVSPTPGSGSSRGSAVFYTIDARGSDAAAVDTRVRAALKSVHKDAIVQAQRSVAERAKRTPGRSSTSPMSGAGVVG